MEIVLCLGHSDVEQATFLLDLGRGSGTTIGRHATIDDVEQIDRLPLLSLGGVDRGKDEVILVEQRHAGLIAGRIGWIQGQFGQEAFAGGIYGGCAHGALGWGGGEGVRLQGRASPAELTAVRSAKWAHAPLSTARRFMLVGNSALNILDQDTCDLLVVTTAEAAADSTDSGGFCLRVAGRPN